MTRAWPATLAGALAGLSILLLGGDRVGAEPAERTVVVESGQTARELADLYLGNPDLWPELLSRNGLTVASDLEAGRELRVPDLPIEEARGALAESLALIQEATSLGGSVFASDLLARAVARRDEALRDGKAGRWEAAYAAADDARGLAEEARDLARERREGRGEAVLSAVGGAVEGRRAEALVWSDRPAEAVLVENERVRTLSSSFAEVSFPDRSQIRLGANAQAVIQSMEVDRLNDRRRTRVSLVEGDAFALLGGSGARDFDVSVESVDARIDSKNFWVRRDGGDAKFANYDDRRVTLSAGQSEVTLGWNQGTVVSDEHGAAEPKDLLPPPVRVGPVDASVHYRDSVLLRWEPVDGAAAYAVEIDRDSRFRSPLLAPTELIEARFLAAGLGRGVYSWRVRAVDEAGFPGAASGAGRFTIEAEGREPYLHVVSPAADGPQGARTVVLRGETEPGVQLSVDGARVAVDEAGRFQETRRLTAGPNTILFEARAPSGRTTRLERRLEYIPGWFAPITYDEGLLRTGPAHFLTRSESLTLSGTTLPAAAVELVRGDERTVASTTSGPEGRFHLSVPLRPGSTELRMRVTTETGFETEERLVATRDSEPPALHLPNGLPTWVRAAELEIAGRVEAGAELEVGGVPVEVRGTDFRAVVALAEGRNEIRLRATDAAGNRTERRIVVARDLGAPLLEEASLAEGPSGRGHAIRVVARDPAGLRRKGWYALARGGRIEAGALRLQADGRTYVADLPRSEGRDTDPARLVYVELEDRLGNRKRYEF